MIGIRIKDYIHPNLLIAPIVLRWLLPVGIEYSLYIDVQGLYIFLPDFLYILYIVGYSGNRYLFRNRNVLNILLFFLFLFSSLLLFIQEGTTVYKLNVFVNNYSFILIPFIYINWPLNRDGLEKVKYTLIFSLLVLFGEVILYSTGILVYTTATGADLTAGLYATGGIMRISTTVGAATGTALIVLMLGCVVSGYYKMSSFMTYAIFVIVSVTLLFTISRGSIMSWVLYLASCSFRKVKQLSLTSIMLYSIVLVVSLSLLNSLGVFEPLANRMDTTQGDISSGRSELNNEAIELIYRFDYLGVGVGNVYPDKIIQYKYGKIIPNYIGMHNIYLTYMAEIGIIGLIMLLLFYSILMIQIGIKKHPTSFAIVCIMLINFNTEAIFVNQEYIALFFLLINTSLIIEKDKKETYRMLI